MSKTKIEKKEPFVHGCYVWCAAVMVACCVLIPLALWLVRGGQP